MLLYEPEQDEEGKYFIDLWAFFTDLEDDDAKEWVADNNGTDHEKCCFDNIQSYITGMGRAILWWESADGTRAMMEMYEVQLTEGELDGLGRILVGGDWNGDNTNFIGYLDTTPRDDGSYGNGASGKGVFMRNYVVENYGYYNDVYWDEDPESVEIYANFDEDDFTLNEYYEEDVSAASRDGGAAHAYAFAAYMEDHYDFSDYNNDTGTTAVILRYLNDRNLGGGYVTDEFHVSTVESDGWEVERDLNFYILSETWEEHKWALEDAYQEGVENSGGYFEILNVASPFTNEDDTVWNLNYHILTSG